MYQKNIGEEACHKTVIVLDRGPKFAEDSQCDLPIHIKDETTQGQPPEHMGTIKKTLWNCSIEAALEFHRVVTDLFPNGSRQLRFVMSDFVGRALTKSWAETNDLISYEELIDALSTCDVPNPKSDATSFSVLTGIALGLEAISEQSSLQKNIINMDPTKRRHNKKRRNTTRAISNDPTTFKEEVEYWRHTKRIDPKTLSRNQRLHEDGELAEKSKSDGLILTNKGNIIVFTSFNKPNDFNVIISDLLEKVKSQNQMVESLVDANRLPIDELFVYIVNISPNFHPEKYGKGNEPSIVIEDLDIPPQKVKATLFNCQAGDELNSVILKILLDIYDLVSTTVSGIPMKEESNPGASISYDVELLHRRESHLLLKTCGLLEKGSQLIARKDHGNFDTVKLKWLSPSQKLKSEMFPLLLDSFPATPAYVNSREAVCLTSFIVNNNKNVMLKIENPPETIEPNLCGNLISHYITHEEATGVMLIQTVAFGPNATLYGKLKQQEKEGIKPNLNYTSFNQLMKSMGTIPESIDSDTEPAIEENFEKAKRSTSYFPASLKDTFIFNIPEKFEPLLTLIPKSELTLEELEKCRKWIYSFIGSKNGSEPFTHKILDCNLLKRTSTRDEQFRVAADEMYKFLRNFVKNSPKHLEICNLFAKLLNFKEVSPHELEIVPSLTGSESPRNRDQRSSSPLAKRSKKLAPSQIWGKNEVINLYEYFNDLYEKEHNAKWRDFVGREKAGDKNPAPLYPNLNLTPATSDPRLNRGGISG
uniref:Protein asunder n=1 Tax=Acrobeloides nanus TaxID=290746 RepID=A0A914DZV5_9BILA